LGATPFDDVGVSAHGLDVANLHRGTEVGDSPFRVVDELAHELGDEVTIIRSPETAYLVEMGAIEDSLDCQLGPTSHGVTRDLQPVTDRRGHER
jgi:hypothetical protein